MTQASMMVHLDLGVFNEPLLPFTAQLAERFNAEVVGVTAYQHMQIVYGDGYMSGEVINQDRALIDGQSAEAADRFGSVLHDRTSRLH